VGKIKRGLRRERRERVRARKAGKAGKGGKREKVRARKAGKVKVSKIANGKIKYPKMPRKMTHSFYS